MRARISVRSSRMPGNDISAAPARGGPPGPGHLFGAFCRILKAQEPFAGEEVRATFEAEGIAVIAAATMTKGIDVRVVTCPTGGVAGASTLGNDISGTSQIVVDAPRRRRAAPPRELRNPPVVAARC